MKLSGLLFVNRKKEKPNYPDYQGQGKTENGTPVKLAAWKKLDRNGAVFLSVCVTVLTEGEAPATGSPQRAQAQDQGSIEFP